MLELSADESDALAELFNIAMGQAARSLSEMVEEPVTLSVPSIRLLPVEDAWRVVDGRTGGEACAVRESFSGAFAGDALLIFPEDKSLEVVRRLIGEDSDLETITEMEQDALMELGNVILTSCTVGFADTLGVALGYTSLPEVVRGQCRDMLVSMEAEQGSVVLFIEVDFGLSRGDISGIVLIALGVNSAKELRDRVQAYLSDLDS